MTARTYQNENTVSDKVASQVKRQSSCQLASPALAAVRMLLPICKEFVIAVMTQDQVDLLRAAVIATRLAAVVICLVEKNHFLNVLVQTQLIQIQGTQILDLEGTAVLLETRLKLLQMALKIKLLLRITYLAMPDGMTVAKTKMMRRIYKYALSKSPT